VVVDCVWNLCGVLIERYATWIENAATRELLG
jgi:hypothetical protein